MEATIFNVQRFSTEDGPGIRTTVFFKGCPLKCAWCHNPEGISPQPQLMWYDTRCIAARDCLAACPEQALELTPGGMKIHRDRCTACGACADECPAAALEIIGRKWSLDELFDEIARDTSFYENSGGGITLSGGEVLRQHEFAAALIEKCKEAELHTAVDTTAFAAPDIFDTVTGPADMVLLDLKTMDEAASREFTGVGLDLVLDNIRRLGQTSKPVWVRTPVIPGATDSDDNIKNICGFIAAHLPNCGRYDLLPFSNLCISKYDRLDMPFRFRKTELIDQKRMEELKALAESCGVSNVVVQGLTVRNA